MAPRIIFESPKHLQRYKRLSKLEIVASRYPDIKTMEELGIFEDVMTLFRRIGWDHMIEARWPTYPSLFLEFLASLEVNDGLSRQREPLGMKFQLLNKEYYITKDQFDELLHCPTGGLFLFHEDFNPSQFWHWIASSAPSTEKDFIASNCKSSLVDNPVFRYIHRSLAYSVFGRSESCKIRFYDMYALWSMLSGNPVSLAAQVMDNWKRQSNATTGKILCGGLLTPIIHHFNISLEGVAMAKHCRDVDVNQLVRSHMLHSSGSDLYLYMPNGDLFKLPNPELTHVTDLTYRDNWWMQTPRHLELFTTIAGRHSPRLLAQQTPQVQESCLETNRQPAPEEHHHEERDTPRVQESSMETNQQPASEHHHEARDTPLVQESCMETNQQPASEHHHEEGNTPHVQESYKETNQKPASEHHLEARDTPQVQESYLESNQEPASEHHHEDRDTPQVQESYMETNQQPVSEHHHEEKDTAGPSRIQHENDHQTQGSGCSFGMSEDQWSQMQQHFQRQNEHWSMIHQMMLDQGTQIKDMHEVILKQGQSLTHLIESANRNEQLLQQMSTRSGAKAMNNNQKVRELSAGANAMYNNQKVRKLSAGANAMYNNQKVHELSAGADAMYNNQKVHELSAGANDMYMDMYKVKKLRQKRSRS